MAPAPLRIDGLQSANWSRAIFQEMRAAGLTAVHATLSYHEGLRETVRHMVDWRARFRDHADLILFARDWADVEKARASNRTAIFLGLQTPMAIEDDLGLVEILYDLGVRFMQLAYNNQSLLGCGWREREDSGITRMGREVIREMNRLGMAVDLSHAGVRTTLEAIQHSRAPVVISHANPRWLKDTARNVSKGVVKALGQSDGLLGLSAHAAHLPQEGATTLKAFGEMAAEAAAVIGVERLGIGSDLNQNQPEAAVRWMREGRWTRASPEPIAFPEQPPWFRSNADFPGLAEGLKAAGFDAAGIGQVLGGAWAAYLQRLKPA